MPQTYNPQTGQWENFTPPTTAPSTGVPLSTIMSNNGEFANTTPTNQTVIPTTPAASVAGTSSVTNPTANTTTQAYASVAGTSVNAPAPGSATVASGGSTGTAAPAPTMTDILSGLGPSAAQYGTSATSPNQNAQLSSAYNQYFAQTSGSAPNTSPTADINQSITNAAQPDPQAQFFDSVASQNPIVAQLYQLTQQIVSPQATQQNFSEEYQNLSTQAGIPQLQSQLLNINNVMNGTSDDIRNEITAAGGFADESQIQALTTTRNNVLVKQATLLEGQLNNQQQYVQNVMQFSQADQAQLNTQVNEQTGLLETMASLQNTMNQNSTKNYQSIVTNLGYTGLAQMFQGNPQGASQAESLLGLNPGSLTNPAWLQNADTLKQLAAQNAAARTNITVETAGATVGLDAARASSQYASAVNSTIKALYPTTASNPINTYQSSQQWVTKLNNAYAAGTDPSNQDKNVSDLELIDAAVKINNGGQQITEQQISTLLGGLSIQAKAEITGDQLTGISTTLTNSQRTAIQQLAQANLTSQKTNANSAINQINGRISSTGLPSSLNLDNISTYTTNTGTSSGVPKGDMSNSQFVEASLEAQGYDYSTLMTQMNTQLPTGTQPALDNSTGLPVFATPQDLASGQYTPL